MQSRGTVLITGASTGIGEACALRMDHAGYMVFAGVRREADGEKLREKSSSRLSPIMLDVTDTASIERAAETVRATVGESGLTGLVNNAGISVPCPIEFIPLRDLRLQLEVNVVGQVAVTQAFLPLLRQSRGRIVLMSSLCGFISMPGLDAYNASKHALEAIADVLRRELQPAGVRVSIVQPVFISTPIWEKSSVEKLPVEVMHHYRSLVRTWLMVGERAM